MKKLFTAIGLLLTLTACTSKSQPSISIYTSLEESVAKALLEAYQKETGVQVDFVRLATGEAAARIEAEGKRPQAALWLGGVGLGHAELKAKGLTAPYASVATSKIPATFKDSEGYWNGIYLGVLAFVTNESQLKSKSLTAPEKWSDVLDPKWKGQIQLPNPGTSGTSFNLITTLITLMGEPKAFDFMKALHKNISQYTKSGAAPTKSVALGETTLAIGYYHDIVRLIEETKAPLKVTFPTDGTGYEIAAVSLLKDGPQPELAKQLVDWLYSKTASQILADYYYIPFMKDEITLKEKALTPADLKLINTDVDWAGKNKQRLIDLWNTRINT